MAKKAPPPKPTKKPAAKKPARAAPGKAPPAKTAPKKSAAPAAPAAVSIASAPTFQAQALFKLLESSPVDLEAFRAAASQAPSLDIADELGIGLLARIVSGANAHPQAAELLKILLAA